MSDDIQLNLNTTVGDKLAADEIGAKKHQRVKAQFGEAGTATDVSATDPMPVIDSNRISADGVNSRAAATLAASGTFQGTVEDVSQYGRVGIAIRSTNATSGILTIEVSHDNVTWGGPTREWADTRFATPHMWNIVEKYFRILYTNGDVEANDLSIQVHYSKNADIVLGHEVNAILPAETEAQAVRPTNSFDLDTARVHITGQKAPFFFGQNNALQNSVFEDVWAGGGNINWQQTAAKVKVASTHADDTAGGLGLQSVELHGLSATGEDQSEVLPLAGIAGSGTEAESALTYIRTNLMHNEEVGTYGGSHRGTVECRVTNATFASGALLSLMTGIEGAPDSSVQFGYGEAQNGFISVPLGKVLYITQLEVIPNASKPIDVILYERDGLLTVGDPFQPRRIVWGADQVEAPVERVFKSHIKIKALADLWFRAQGSAAVAGVSVWLDYFLVDADPNGA